MKIIANSPYVSTKPNLDLINLLADNPYNQNCPLLIVSDVDSTFIKQEVIELIADYAGVRNQVAEITQRAMRGEIDFVQSLIERVSLLTGLRADVLTDIRSSIELSDGASSLVDYVNDQGHIFALVSGGFTQVLDPLCDEYGIKNRCANRLEIVNGVLTGRLLGPIIDAQAKAHYLHELAQQLSIPKSNIIAVGDGANDLLMLKAASWSVSFNGKPVVQEASKIQIEGPNFDHIIGLITYPAM